MVLQGDHRMTLKDWLAKREISIPQFAARIGRTPEAVRRYAAGERIPDKDTMPLIASETGNEVTANDFFGIAPSPQQAA
jgi:transcriptional regulator with XRE-family HTH domain